jgi:hypothetical protein
MNITISKWPFVDENARSRLDINTYLDDSVRGAQKFNKSWDHSAANNLVDRGIALFGEQLAEAGGSSKLLFNVVRHDSLDHSRELFVELMHNRK